MAESRPAGHVKNIEIKTVIIIIGYLGWTTNWSKNRQSKSEIRWPREKRLDTESLVIENNYNLPIPDPEFDHQLKYRIVDEDDNLLNSESVVLLSSQWE